MPEETELQVEVRKDFNGYTVELRLRRPDEQTEHAPVRGPAALDPDALRPLRHKAEAYGRKLGEQLLSDPKVKEFYHTAVAVTDVEFKDLRVRLVIDRSAQELHDLRWETLRDPDSDPAKGDWLLTRPKLYFSRFLSSDDLRPVRPLSKQEFRALVVIANPTTLADAENPVRPEGRRLDPVPVADERRRAEDGLKPIKPVVLATDKVNGEWVTLDRIAAELRRDRGYDIVILVAHGVLAPPTKGDEAGQDRKTVLPEPKLLLDKKGGGHELCSGLKLVKRVATLDRPPRLVVLASCESAGGETSDDGALAALGPRLAVAGVPAVLAMQGRITMETLEVFLPAFFAKLRETGQVDRAMTAGRQAVVERDDAWAPTLFLRLRDGRLWYEPGLYAGDGTKTYEGWDALVTRIAGQECVPVLGPGLLEDFFSPTRILARRWAKHYRFPLSRRLVDDLPQVTQFLRYQQEDVAFADTLFSESLLKSVKKRHGKDLSEELKTADLKTLGPLLEAVGRSLRAKNPTEPHRVLARLPLPVYLTTSPFPILEQALAEEKKVATPVNCAWKVGLADRYKERFDKIEKTPPGPDNPLVFHLFGSFDDRESLVTAEEDYYNYLVYTAQFEQAAFPSVIQAAPVSNALLFLGFEVDDWVFRVLLRSIAKQPRDKIRFPRLAVQMTPEEGRLRDQERGRKYFEKYYSEWNKIRIFWGSLEDFIQMLRERWNKRIGDTLSAKALEL
jgi:hypothetical protein